jgi:hypothetical protein
MVLLDSWTEYCAKSDELALLVLKSHDRFDKEILKKIDDTRRELDRMLDAMIGGE